MEASPRSRPATVQKSGSTNTVLSSEANGATASNLRKEAKNSRRPSQKSLRGKQLDRSDGGDASPSHSYASAVNQSDTQADHVPWVVEQPLYTEVIENSSCHPVAHADVAGVTTRAKVPGASISSAATAACRDNPQQLDPNDFPSVTEVAEKTRKPQKQLAAARNADNGNAARHPLSPAPSAFVNRVSSIPAVAETVHLLTNSVGSIARRNRVAKIAVDTTKQAATIGVTLADKLAAPVKPALENVIQKFDGRAADLLDKGLRKYPIISKQPSEIATQVRNTAVYAADNTVHRVLAYKPASFVASLTAKTVLSMNRGVDTVLHKARLQDPNTHTQLYNTVDWLGNGVLHIVDESRSGHWQRPALMAA